MASLIVLGNTTRGNFEGFLSAWAAEQNLIFVHQQGEEIERFPNSIPLEERFLAFIAPRAIVMVKSTHGDRCTCAMYVEKGDAFIALKPRPNCDAWCVAGDVMFFLAGHLPPSTEAQRALRAT